MLVTTEEKGGREEDYKEQNDEEANLSGLKTLERERERKGEREGIGGGEGKDLMEISLRGEVPSVGEF